MISLNQLHETKCVMLGQPITKWEKKKRKNWKEVCKEKLNFDPDLCPCCKKGRMVTKELIEKSKRGPPEISSWSNLQIVY